MRWEPVSPDLQDQLVTAHPHLYREGMDFRVQDGWFALLQDLSAHLEPMCEAKFASGEPLYATQVKEKFGGLRFHLNWMPPEAEALIEAAKERALRTCEVCGGAGTLRIKGGWYATTCDAHAEGAVLVPLRPARP